MSCLLAFVANRILRESYHIPQVYGAARFLLPVSQCEFQLTQILEGLKRDPWPVANDKRPLRCTGVAMSVAVGLLEATYVWVSLFLCEYWSNL